MHYPALEPLVETITAHLDRRHGAWQAEVVLFGHNGRQVLICRGSPLRGEGKPQGEHVIVFDDVTALIQAQRDAAWGEVARRLPMRSRSAHADPLSAERLRHNTQHHATEDAES